MSTNVDLFIDHIKIIREEGFTIVSEITEEYGQIEICFDDGFAGIYDNIELLIKLNVPIHLFLISSFIDNDNYLSRKQLIYLKELSIIRISSHSDTHCILPSLTQERLFEELMISKEKLQKLLNKEVNSICFPEGKFSSQVIEFAKKTMYINFYSSIPGFYFTNRFLSVVNRSLVQFASLSEFKAILKGGDHILSFWYKSKHFIK